MSTESLGGTRPIVLRKQHESEHLSISFINGAGAALSQGDEVIMKTDGTLDKRDAGTEFPIGFVEKGGADGERVTVGTAFVSTLEANADGAPLEEGTLVKPLGTKTGGLPDYVVVANGDYVSAVVIKGALAEGQAQLGILRAPFRTSDPAP